MQAQILLARIVVDETDRGITEARRTLHLADHQLRRVAGSGDDHLAPARDERRRARPLDQGSRDQAGAGDERHEQEPVEDGHRTRQLKTAHRMREQDDEVGDDARRRHSLCRAPHVACRDVSPPAVVEAERDERAELQDDGDPDRVLEQALVRLRDTVVEAQPEREPPGERDQARIGEHVPDAVTIDRDHRATTTAASRTAATTRSCVAASIPAHKGTEKFSCATRSVSGSEPGA